MIDRKIQNADDLHSLRSALVVDVLCRRDVFSRGEKRAIRLRVLGESMLPTLWPGDAVEIEACSNDQLHVGDLVLAVRDGRLFLHRLVSQNLSSGFILRGDSMPAPDALFPPKALLGRLISRDGWPTPSSLFRARIVAKISLSAGFFLCHCSLARRIVLGIHRRRKASRRPQQAFHATTELSTP